MTNPDVPLPDGADATVYVDGVQGTNGTVTWSLFVLADDRESMTSDQFAAMISAAAEEMDRSARPG